MQFLMGLDIGTTGTKAIVIDEEGRIISRGYREYKLYHRKPIYSELDPKEVWDGIKGAIKDALTGIDSRNVKAVGVSALGEAFMPVSKSGEPLYWSMTTFDARARKYVEEWGEKMPEKEMFQITGQPLSPDIPIYTLHKIMWIRDHEPDIYNKTWKFMCWEDFFFFKLCGRPVIDYTLATRTMMFDIVKKRWSEDILNTAKLEEDILPEVGPSALVVGEVNEKGARETGLAKGTLLVTGGHDQACGAFGAGITEEGPLMDATGTVECYGIVQDRLVLKDDMRLQGYAVHVYVDPEKYYMFGFTPTGGAALRWIRDNFAKDLLEIEARTGKGPYDILNEEAEKSEPGAKGLMFFPYLEGSGTPDWNRNILGIMAGLTLAHNRGDVVRALFEGLAYELRWNVESIRKFGIKVSEIRTIGGGAKSKLWLKIKASVTGLSIRVPEAKMDTVALGAALLAGIGSGIYADFLDAVRRTIRFEATIEPSKELLSKYEIFYKRYLASRKYLVKPFTEDQPSP
ncbi:MAG: hypothetical protein DRJ59_01460 [Thermoprotei archaeon]|nr:MAG: hypothetical protein DRJ59_01460 [Thermoprotei archaeon]